MASQILVAAGAVALSALCICGIRISSRDGMLLHPIYEAVSRWQAAGRRPRIRAYIGKPLFTCGVCMSSTWGAFLYLAWSILIGGVSFEKTWPSILIAVPAIAALCGMMMGHYELLLATLDSEAAKAEARRAIAVNQTLQTQAQVPQ